MTEIAAFLTESFTTIQLRRRASKMGLPGLSSSKKTALVPAITAKLDEVHAEALAEDAARAPKTIAQEVAEVVAESAKPKGRSRAGQVMEVRPMSAGENKAATVSAKLATVGIDSEIENEDGEDGESFVVLSGEGFRIVWHLDGQYAYDETSLDTAKGGSRKIRNASDLLRVKGFKK